MTLVKVVINYENHYNINMKKIFFAALILISSNFLLFSQVSSDAQIIKSEHWVYQDLMTLSSELRIGNFSTNTPITVGEIKMYYFC